MSQMNDSKIRKYCDIASPPPMIVPFVDTLVRKDEQGEPIVSYGLSSFGYDMRLADTFKIANTPLLDPKNLKESDFLKIVAKNGYIDIPPHGFVLGHTVEYIKMPPHCLAICLGKSTYARLGLIVNVTPLEPCWEGNVTLELSNTTDAYVRVYCNEGIAQFLFFEGSLPDVDYSSRAGKYQGQTGVTIAKV